VTRAKTQYAERQAKAAALAAAHDRSGLSASELARRLGIAPEHVHNIRSATRGASDNLVARWAAACAQPVAWTIAVDGPAVTVTFAERTSQ